MFISFERNKKKDCTQVFVHIDTELPVELPVLAFGWECGKQYIAALLEQHLTAMLSKKLKAIRKASYEDGWKDAEAKRAKQHCFSGTLT